MGSGDVDIHRLVLPSCTFITHLLSTPPWSTFYMCTSHRCSAPDAVLPPTHQAGQGSFELSAIHVCLAGILACWAKKLAALVCSGRATKSCYLCVVPIFTQMKCLGRNPDQWHACRS
jgi:hypothetical protein